MKKSLLLRALAGAAVVVAMNGCSGDAPALSPADARLDAARTTGVQMVAVFGDGQTGTAGQMLPGALTVRVTDQKGLPVAGAVVNWLVGPGEGTVSVRQGTTDANGYAWTRWTPGPATGTQTVRASGTGGTVVFTATITPPSPPATAGAPVAMYVLPNPMWLAVGDTGRLRVVFLDARGNVVPGPKPRFINMSNYNTVTQDGLVRSTVTAAGGIEVRAWPFRAFASVNPWQRTQDRYGAPREAVYIVPEAAQLFVGDTLQLNALWVNAAGVVSNARGAAWSALSRGTSVSPAGLATAVSVPGAAIYAYRGDKKTRADISVSERDGSWSGGLLLDGMTITPGAGRTVTFTTYTRRDGPGRQATFSVQLRGPDGKVAEHTFSGASGTLSFPASAPGGRYDIVRVLLTNTAGITNSVYTSQLQYLDNPTSFTVPN